MGNFVSCVLPANAGGKRPSAAAARVVFPGGEVRELEGPTKAAELMLETPSHFVVNSRSVRAGRRFVALSADEDLEMSQMYVLFPMKRVNSVVTAGDVGTLFPTANAKRGRILPECFDAGCAHDDDAAESLMEPTKIGDHDGGSLKLNLDDIEDTESKEFMNRLSLSRSKKPLLETIVEESK